MKIIFSIFFICLLLVGCTKGNKGDDPIEAKKKEIEQALKATLPIGTSVQDVVAYLDSKKLDHDNYDRSTKQLGAIERKVFKSLFTRTDVQIFFQFDEKDKLKGFTLKEIYTGL
jgi:PBP1b-binding outer membrane lipoprotein LpoB